MTTKQSDTVAMTERQLDTVAGGFDVGPVGRRSFEPNPSPSPISIEPLPSPFPRPWFTRVGFRSLDPIPSL